MTTEAAGLGLAGVLAAHGEVTIKRGNTDRGGLVHSERVCICGHELPWLEYADDHRAHVAEEVRTWLRAALTSPEVVDAAANTPAFASPNHIIARTVLAAAAETLGAK